MFHWELAYNTRLEDQQHSSLSAGASEGKFYDTTRWFPDFIFDHVTGSMSDFDTFVQFLEAKSPLDYVTEGRIGVHVFKILFCS